MVMRSAVSTLRRMEWLDTLWECTPLRRAVYGLSAFVLFVVVAALNARSSSSAQHLPTVPGSPARDQALYGAKIPLPKEEKAVVQQFVQGAVLRRDLAGAWAVSSGSVHGDASREQWLKGTIPVLPFPAEAFKSATIQVEYSRERGSLLLVTVSSRIWSCPLPGVLHRAGQGERGLEDRLIRGPRGTGTAGPEIEDVMRISRALPLLRCSGMLRTHVA